MIRSDDIKKRALLKKYLVEDYDDKLILIILIISKACHCLTFVQIFIPFLE